MLICKSLLTIWCWESFHIITMYYFTYFILFAMYRSYFVKCLFRSLAYFSSICLFSYSWFLRVLCMYWITVLYWCVFCKFFPLSVTCLLILLTWTFAYQFIMLMKSSLSIIFFMHSSTGVVHKKPSPNPRLSKFFSMFCSMNFLVIHLIFRTIIHIVIFCQKCKDCV